MLTVYKQATPIPTGERMYRSDNFGNRDATEHVWCKANLVKVGEVETWSEAKKLCAAPIVEVKT